MEDQIYITIAKVLHDEASDAERRELDAWIQADKTNAGIFEEMKRTWSEADALFETPEFDAAPAWEKVSAKIHESRTDARPKQGRTIAFPSWIKYSSAIAAILIIALFIWNPLNTGNIEVIAKKDAERLELPDHSIITLREGSRLRYPKAFDGAERKVALEGEAFFEVTRNEQQPFVIDAQAVSVKVLGTSFNVTCDDEAAEVAVVTGRVQVAAQANAQQTVILTAGRAAQYRDGSLTQGPSSFWKDGKLTFSDKPFVEVVESIAKVKDTAIRLDEGLSAVQRQQAITISFQRQPLEDMLTELCLISNCRWEKAGADYVIKAK